MGSITEDEYRKHMAGIVSEGFTLDPPGYEQLSLWTHILMHLVNAQKNFEWALDHPKVSSNSNNFLQQNAFFISGIMAYGRCYASSGGGIPTLDAKRVYAGSEDGIAIHQRLIDLRNKIAAHTDESDLVRLTLAVKDEPDHITIRHIYTNAIPTDEIPDFLEAVSHTSHFVTVSLNKRLNKLEKNIGKKISLD